MDIFISYRRDGGADSARILQLKLKENGYKVFLEYDELKYGIFNKKIINALNHSKIFLFVLSEHSLDKCVNEEDSVRKEIMYAIDKNMVIIPVVPNAVYPEIPENIPQQIIDVLSCNQFEVHLGQQLNSDVKMLIEDRIKPLFVGKSSSKKHSKTIIPILIIFVVIVLGVFLFKNSNNDTEQSVSDIEMSNSETEPVLSETEYEPVAQQQPEETEQREYTQTEYEKVGSFKNGFAKIRTSEGFGFINRNNEVVVAPIYDKAEDFCNGFAEVKKNGKWGFVNSQGDLAIACKFDDVFNFHEGMAIIKEGGKCGFIDETGEIVIPAIYQSARAFRNGTAKVKIDGNWTLIDKNGNEVY